ncbi:hypothetical protein EVAR_47097_1 [Eumeta japonica]|uniref:Uncharacterized protein n=1 Tax=Eumeta variegata TaxID=151549 RepID=A0A4C1YCZ8_EUMVA|nr:hypothetical protein EVAR_47097_1 [Eumeta japonica]
MADRHLCTIVQPELLKRSFDIAISPSRFDVSARDHVSQLPHEQSSEDVFHLVTSQKAQYLHRLYREKKRAEVSNVSSQSFSLWPSLLSEECGRHLRPCAASHISAMQDLNLLKCR